MSQVFRVVYSIGTQSKQSMGGACQSNETPLQPIPVVRLTNVIWRVFDGELWFSMYSRISLQAWRGTLEITSVVRNTALNFGI